jgi:hypothetical protein
MTTIFDVADSHLFSSSLAKSALVFARKYEPGDCYSLTCICWEAPGSDFGPEDTLTRFFLIYLQSLLASTRIVSLFSSYLILSSAPFTITLPLRKSTFITKFISINILGDEAEICSHCGYLWSS